MSGATGKRARLYDLRYGHGVGNGTMVILPIDHGLEHGPIDFLPNPPSADPDFQLDLALRGGCNAIACQIGFAERHWPPYAGRVPLVLKLNGKTGVPSDEEAHSPLNASVEDAVRLGAHAVGYTLYVGSPLQSRHHEDLAGVRADCVRWGMPLIVWAYPRGSAIDARGGRSSLYAVDYAARAAMELGADAVKLDLPRKGPWDEDMPEAYRELDWDEEEGARRVTASAQGVPVLVSGGSRGDPDEAVRKARMAMRAGAAGLMFGRNLWQRPMDEALEVLERIRALMSEHPS